MFFKHRVAPDRSTLWVADDVASSTFRKTIKFVAIGLLTLGILFRFTNLDLKPYWLDEAFTSLRLSGYSDTEVTQQIENRILTVQDLQKYQQPAPEKTSIDTIAQLANREPQLTPLYFVLLRVWVQCFGSSIAAIRSLSAIFSLLAFPCLYWLCLELFSSRCMAWMMIALVAVSPIHLIYAQEARPTSLWILMLLVSCASLLRAMREQTRAAWMIYAVSIGIGFYAHLFTAFVSIAHAVYVLLQERFWFSKNLIAFALSSIVGWLLFAPWIVFGLFENRQAMAGQSLAAPVTELIKGWLRGISLVFVDFSVNEQSPRLYLLIFLAIFLSVLSFVGVVLFCFWRSTPRSAKLFVLTTIAVPYLLLVVSDLASGASRSATARYLLPAYLGIQLAVAFVLTTRITGASRRYQKIWITLAAWVLSIGLFSCGLMASSELWWNKAEANIERQLAQTVNRSTKPLVITDDYFVKFLSFSHSLAPDINVQVLLQSAAVPNIPSGFSDVFLYRPSNALQQRLAIKYRLQSIHPPLLWKLQQKR